MPLGSTYPSESHMVRDSRTGVAIRQVTSFSAIHHHPFYYIPAYDDSGERLFFVSHRTGLPQLYFEDRPGGAIVQISDRPDLNEWSCHPAWNGRHAYYTAGNAAWRVDLEAMREEQVATLGETPIRQPGMVGASMGTTSLSTDNRWWCVYVKVENKFRLHVIDVQTGEDTVILERATIAHPQFHPDDASLLRYAGPHEERIWTIRRDGSENRLVYHRDAARKEWIVHETWLTGTREIVTTNWPHGVMAINIDSGDVRWIVRTNAWHPMVNRAGTQLVADTTNPDVGLILCDPRQECGPIESLCASNASNVGDHWRNDHCPYDDGPVEAYAPQHTHPHPNFSPEGRRVIFTSDQQGFAQVYEVEVPVK
ncbi:oligogalacturonate lyase family protein [Bythopirellula polymerisocia]|uniref:Oligogalacturonate lyase n=1 Tax=Bythopirellula polymerisocia TaxID=2528003 RepID=A0A5C6CY22_9BACT|nr:oligogalacturonate lyase family protein [Bythopirellula polymerisocia]TWU27886.1 Oligogalacturonate lyase [Bythopirellula polymerisocia]